MKTQLYAWSRYSRALKITSAARIPPCRRIDLYCWVAAVPGVGCGLGRVAIGSAIASPRLLVRRTELDEVSRCGHRRLFLDGTLRPSIKQTENCEPHQEAQQSSATDRSRQPWSGPIDAQR